MKGAFVKVVVTVPEEDADKVRQAIGHTGGGNIGNYSRTSFSMKGIGRFRPENGAKPAIGKIGNLESVVEERIEVTCKQSDLSAVITAIKHKHPYEEPVIDIYPLLTGIG